MQLFTLLHACGARGHSVLWGFGVVLTTKAMHGPETAAYASLQTARGPEPVKPSTLLWKAKRHKSEHAGLAPSRQVECTLGHVSLLFYSWEGHEMLVN